MSDATLKVIQVGYACGFNNPSHFIRVFKDVYGLTPNQYKSKQKIDRLMCFWLIELYRQ
jgi:two-component system response regulator YesN